MSSAFAEPPEVRVVRIRTGSGQFVVRPAPRREPPFDDELADAGGPARYDRPLPFERPRRPPVPSGPVTARHPGVPEPAQWGQRLLVGVIETAAGHRPLNQLTALVSPSVACGLRGEFERAAVLGRPHWLRRASVRSVRATEPADRVAELCATVAAEGRVRAVAMRLEVRHGRWCCTRLMIG